MRWNEPQDPKIPFNSPSEQTGASTIQTALKFSKKSMPVLKEKKRRIFTLLVG